MLPGGPELPQNNQKPLSDWLVVSDIDGTLNSKLRRLPPVNYQAIDRFVNTLGGTFTLASGRGVASMRKHYLKLPINNTPAIVLNGAGIYDYANEKMICFESLSDGAKQLALDVLERFPLLEAEIAAKDYIYLVRARIFSPLFVAADKLPHKRVAALSEITDPEWGKLVFMGPSAVISKAVKYIHAKRFEDACFLSTSIFSYEMMPRNTHKGTAVLKLAQMLGIHQKHTAAIGDYFNDYDMLQAVALPAVCKQAPQKMHDIAKFHAVHCNKGSIADLLQYIEQNYSIKSED